MYVKTPTMVALSEETLRFYEAEYEALSNALRLQNAGVPTDTPWVIHV